jgi:RNA polymerase sigma factor (sigma-70 family)
MTDFPTVYLIEDDEALRLATGTTLRLAGYMVRDYASAELFLADIDINPAGCLVTDLRLPGMSGIELQQTLITRNIKVPVIIVTGYGEIRESVQAVKAGAVDFLEKPVTPDDLLQRVQEALRLDELRCRQENANLAEQECFNELSPREKEVIALVVAGKTNKEIARHLEISHRTVEKHRANAMLKLNVDNTVQLLKVVQHHLPEVV